MAVTAWPSYTITTSHTNVWNQWGGYGTTSSTTIMTSADNYAPVWERWLNAGTTTTITGSCEGVWHYWVEEDERTAERQLYLDELQERRERASRERLATEQKRREDMATASARATELLEALLTEDERAQRERDGWVEVTGTDGRLYRIEMHRHTVHGNIVRTDEHGCLLGRACVAPEMYAAYESVMPTEDGWVGQLLGLRHDTAEFLSHANWSGVTACTVLRERAA